MNDQAKTIIYITYDGVLEPLGQSQVLSYLKLLATDWRIILISFEKKSDLTRFSALHHIREEIIEAQIDWYPLRYHKRPPVLATAWDILRGIILGLRLVKRRQVSIVHARSYVSALIALFLKQLAGPSLIFDMRGFWADERVDGGLWPANGRMYKLAKWFEKIFLLHADHVVVLTNSAVRELTKFRYLSGRTPPLTVIPTCANLELFTPNHLVPKEFFLGYVGSAGTWYEFDAVASCFAELLKLKPLARILIINRNDHSYIRDRLANAGVAIESIELRAAEHWEVPAQINRVQAGIFFYKPSFSRAGCAPTKLAEFLGSGVPCFSNRGVGDISEILINERTGVVIDTLTSRELHNGLIQLIELLKDPEIKARSIATAVKYFSLPDGVKKYNSVYRTVSELAS